MHLGCSVQVCNGSRAFFTMGDRGFLGTSRKPNVQVMDFAGRHHGNWKARRARSAWLSDLRWVCHSVGIVVGGFECWFLCDLDR